MRDAAAVTADPLASDSGGFYVAIPWRNGAPNDLSKMVGVQIKPGTPMSESLASITLLGLDEDTVKSLSTPVALLKAREMTTNPATSPPPSPEVQREAAQRIFRTHRGAAHHCIEG